MTNLATTYFTQANNRLPGSVESTDILFSDVVLHTDLNVFDDKLFKDLMVARKGMGSKLDKNSLDLRGLKLPSETKERIFTIYRYSHMLMIEPSEYMLSKRSRGLFQTDGMDLTTKKALMVLINAISEVDKRISSARIASLLHLYNIMMFPI